MGLDSRRRTLLLRWFLSCITAGFIMRCVYPSLYIWRIADYDMAANWQNFFSHSLWWKSTDLTICVYLFFYFGLQFVADRFVVKKMDKKIREVLSASNSNEIHFFTENVRVKVRNGLQALIKTRLLIPKKRYKDTDEITYREIAESFKSILITSLHILVCSLLLNKVFSLNGYGLWILIFALLLIAILFFYIIKLLPFFRYLNKTIVKMAKEEHNALVD